jgi:DNA cross-link repair 1A protein
VAFIPTGWEMGCKNKISDCVNATCNGNITIYGIPYSEHSSFTELRRFVQFLKPAEVIPTVHAECSTKRTAMMKHFRQWLSAPSVLSLKRSRVEDQYVQQKMVQYLKPQTSGEK